MNFCLLQIKQCLGVVTSLYCEILHTAGVIKINSKKITYIIYMHVYFNILSGICTCVCIFGEKSRKNIHCNQYIYLQLTANKCIKPFP